MNKINLDIVNNKEIFCNKQNINKWLIDFAKFNLTGIVSEHLIKTNAVILENDKYVKNSLLSPDVLENICHIVETGSSKSFKYLNAHIEPRGLLIVQKENFEKIDIVFDYNEFLQTVLFSGNFIVDTFFVLEGKIDDKDLYNKKLLIVDTGIYISPDNCYYLEYYKI